MWALVSGLGLRLRGCLLWALMSGLGLCWGVPCGSLGLGAVPVWRLAPQRRPHTLPCPTPTPAPAPGKLRVIAEPGRYFAEAFATYACHINGWRGRTLEDSGEQLFDYYITDGLYGSMNW